MPYVIRWARRKFKRLRLKPKEHATGLIGFAAQIQRSSLIGSYVMETAEHREPCKSRGSRTVLGARGGEIPPRDSTIATDANVAGVGSGPKWPKSGLMG